MTSRTPPGLRVSGRFAALSLFATLCFAGCGGGDSGTAPASNSTNGTSTQPTTPVPAAPAPPAAFAVRFTPASLTVTSDAGVRRDLDLQSAGFSLTNVPENVKYYRYRWNGTVVKDVTVTMNSQSTGSLAFHTLDPGILGAGTYSDAVELRFCEDAACSTPVSGGSAELAVTLIVTGDPLPSTAYQLIPPANLRLRAQTTDTDGKHGRAVLGIYNVPPAGVYVRFTERVPPGSPSLIDSVDRTFSGSMLDLDVTFEPGNRFEPGVYTQELISQVCFDSSCNREVRTGPLSLPLELDVRASENKDFVMRRLAINAGAVAWDAIGGKLYVLTITASGSSLLEVDPRTATVLRSSSLTSEPRRIALSGDGQYAYITFDQNPQVRRYRLANLAHDLDITLPGYAITRELAVAPGAPETFAILLDDPGKPLGIAIYDGATPRAQGFAETYIGGVFNQLGFVWGSTAGRLYVSQFRTPGIIAFDVSSTGLTQVAFTSIPDFLPPIQAAGTRIYSSNYATKLRLFDPATQTSQSTPGLACCGESVTIDAAQGRVFRSIAGGVERSTFDGSARVANATLSDYRTSYGNIIRWGNDGLALVDSEHALVFIAGSFVKP